MDSGSFILFLFRIGGIYIIGYFSLNWDFNQSKSSRERITALFNSGHSILQVNLEENIFFFVIKYSDILMDNIFDSFSNSFSLFSGCGSSFISICWGGIGGCKIDIDNERIKVSLITRDNDETDAVTISKKRR